MLHTSPAAVMGRGIWSRLLTAAIEKSLDMNCLLEAEQMKLNELLKRHA